LLIIPFSGTEGFTGVFAIDNLSKVVPQVLASLGFIFSPNVNLIPSLTIAVVPAKALAPILVTLSAEIVVKELVPLKASAPINVIVSGKIIEVISVLSLKAPTAILVAPVKSVATKSPSQGLATVAVASL
jgi:hypothetical protein